MDDRPADKWTKLLSDIIVSPPRVPSSLLLVCKLIREECMQWVISTGGVSWRVTSLWSAGNLQAYIYILQLEDGNILLESWSLANFCFAWPLGLLATHCLSTCVSFYCRLPSSIYLRTWHCRNTAIVNFGFCYLNIYMQLFFDDMHQLQYLEGSLHLN